MSNLPLRFALRYLFARKSHNVINIISGISVAGMAIGTAALIIILSVFNGFNKLVSDSLGDAQPDLVVKPAAGKAASSPCTGGRCRGPSWAVPSPGRWTSTPGSSPP